MAKIQMAKNVNCIDLPIQARFFILQYAKLRMHAKKSQMAMLHRIMFSYKCQTCLSADK